MIRRALYWTCEYTMLLVECAIVLTVAAGVPMLLVYGIRLLVERP